MYLDNLFFIFMKKLLLTLLSFCIPLVWFSLESSETLSKSDACKLKEGYFLKKLSVSFPWYDAMTNEFILKTGKLVYFVYLVNWDSIEKVFAYEYNCKTKKPKEIWLAIQQPPYGILSLEGASSKWIIWGYEWWDWPWVGPRMDMVFMNRRTWVKKIMDFSQFSWFSSIVSIYKVDKKALDIGMFKSTGNPNIFYATLALYKWNSNDGYWEIANKNWKRVIVDVSKKTMKLR